jgi:amino acid adenylation domain-containing protein
MRTGDRILVVAPRGPHAVIGILSVVMAGGIYVPLDAYTPNERLSFIADDCSARFVLHVGGSELGAGKQYEFTRTSGAGRKSDIDLERATYIIYTSGSTGRPKGVAVSAESVLHLFAGLQSAYQFVASDVWTLFHSIGFDFSVWEMWGALLHGGELVVVARDDALSAANYFGVLVEHGVTVVNQTPSAFAGLTAARRYESAATLARLAVRLVILGGEALDYALCKPWLEPVLPNVIVPGLFNMYGITEATVHTTIQAVSPALITSLDARLLIGRLIPGYRIYLLSESGRPCSDGETGEIHIAGCGVALGYVNAQAQDCERFLEILDQDGRRERVFRTGDLALRRGEDFFYQGRVDAQIKLNGYRIEPAEIEACLRELEIVSDCAVVRVELRGVSQLVAFLTVNGGGTLSHVTLAVHCATRLPRFMVPSCWQFLISLPRTENGKMDKKQLVASLESLEEPETPTGHSPVADTSLCGALASLFAARIGVSSVNTASNFFDLGANSLSLTLFRQDLRDQLGIEVELVDLFDFSSIDELSTHIHARLGNTTIDSQNRRKETL